VCHGCFELAIHLSEPVDSAGLEPDGQVAGEFTAWWISSVVVRVCLANRSNSSSFCAIAADLIGFPI